MKGMPNPIAAALAAMFCCICLALAQNDPPRADGAQCFGSQCSGVAMQVTQCSGPVSASPPNCAAPVETQAPAESAPVAVAAPAPTCGCNCPDCTCTAAAPEVAVEYVVVSEAPTVVHSEHVGIFRDGPIMQRGPLRRLFGSLWHARRERATARRAAFFGRLAHRSSQAHAMACARGN